MSKKKGKKIDQNMEAKKIEIVKAVDGIIEEGEDDEEEEEEYECKR